MEDNRIGALAQQVVANSKYQAVYPEIVLRLSTETLKAGLTGKAAVKTVRNKLHQIGGAYLKQPIKLSLAKSNISQLPENIHAQEVKTACRHLMRSHSSTDERLPILDDFFMTCLERISPVTSVLDLACGLNPLAIPWMPLTEQFQYTACDIYLDMLALIDTFFNTFHLDGHTLPCDLVSDGLPWQTPDGDNTLEAGKSLPNKRYQVAFLLKSIPCLEQLDKAIASRLLDSIPANHILVSYPVQSLGGRKKGMVDYYTQHFQNITLGKSWKIQTFRFSTELAFLVTK